MIMKEFTESSALLSDGVSLRARLERDGYLFFRGLVDRAPVMEVRRDILTSLAEHGWLAATTSPDDAMGGAERLESSDAWWDGYHDVLSLEAVNRIAHDAPVVDVIRLLADEEVIVHPRKVVRIIWPGIPATPPHQDVTHAGGCIDFFTCWVALGEVHKEDGPLRILAGSHRDGVLALETATGAGGRRCVGVSDDDERWVTADFEPGDVVMFHSMTVHAALPNSSKRLRLSIDNRYQGVSRPITSWSMAPHYAREPLRSLMTTGSWDGAPLPTWGDFTANWTTERWIEVPEGIEVIDAPPLAPPDRALGRDEPRSSYVDTTNIVRELEVATTMGSS